MTIMATETTPVGADEQEFVAVARRGDAAAFAVFTERYRRELQVHCYRMLASYEDAQDLTQETFLRAWDKRATFEGRAALRAWLYRIATNACLDHLGKRRHRIAVPVETPDQETEVLHLQPLPDDPQDTAVARETIELAFIVAVQHLSPRARAALILRDVLGWSASQTAQTLELTVASANSALQRARETMRTRLPDARLDWSRPQARELDAAEQDLVRTYMAAQEALDFDRLGALLRDEVRFSMPPEPGAWDGRDTVLACWREGLADNRPGDFRCLATTSNRQPAVAVYLRDEGSSGYRPMALDVLQVVDGQVAEVVTFPPTMFDWFGLPASLPGASYQHSVSGDAAD